MNDWSGVALLFIFSFLGYIVSAKIFKDKTKASTIALATYILVALILWKFGWNVKIVPIVVAGIAVLSLNLLGLKL
ncbi:hypothetical protein CL1_2033 [Thermococcus cleftensis]|uniref:Uncharacterized protein n=1 Tax=Thermococcus cleftensis (strain DSM 27260 / KACC 17922 / CL1) TaxID=163003 RepID=I3ZWZ2_THECF|nr:hypothetical protein [Thermococcus cleftensis]AFL96226.1 hypothetical protein CL1_2033 [Thermococcus cleftensis]